MTTQNQRLTYDDIVVTISNLKPQEQLDLLEFLSSSLRKNLNQKEKEHSLLELEGLGADLWKNIDIEGYVSRERDSWN